jgi:hypothetical protein
MEVPDQRGVPGCFQAMAVRTSFPTQFAGTVRLPPHVEYSKAHVRKFIKHLCDIHALIGKKFMTLCAAGYDNRASRIKRRGLPRSYLRFDGYGACEVVVPV